MTRRERLWRTFRGESVDRPPVCFYEINGLTQDPDHPDPYNIYADPSWRPLLTLAAEATDCIVLTGVGLRNAPPDPAAALTRVVTREEGASRLTETTVRAPGRTLRQRTRRDRDVQTVWTLEHLLKDADDLRAWLDLPEAPLAGTPAPDPVLALDRRIGETGVVALDTPDPLCAVASLFSMEDFTVIAMTEPDLFHRALARVARRLHWRMTAVAAALPGRLWRIYGPEYASPPYLPPCLFREYVVGYVTPMVEAIRRHGGVPRIHSHGNLDAILEALLATGACGLDPVEPPPQGDVTLADVRARTGDGFVLFGNLEASDIETLLPDRMRTRVETALREGPDRAGSAFVLMPSACPYGRVLSERAFTNYRVILETLHAATGTPNRASVA